MPLTVLNVAYPLAAVSGATAGGAEQVLLTIDRGLVRAGYRSLVLAAAGSRCSGLLIPVDVPTANLDDSAKREARRRFRWAMEDVIARFSPDIIHMHGIDFSEYMPQCDLPTVVTLHLPLSWYPIRALQITRANVSLVCVSRSQERTAPEGVRISRVISNGVDIHQFRPTARKGNYVLFMGRICPEKGLHLAMDAAARAGEKLLIAGTVFDYPEHRDYFDKWIRPRLDGHAALFLGSVGGRRKAHLLAGAQCLLVPSLALETSSLISMEAMAAGTPVIAWRSGALAEIVTSRRGFVVSSVEEMAAAIPKVKNLNVSECRREAESRFASEQMISAYLQLYRQVAAGDPVSELQAA